MDKTWISIARTPAAILTLLAVVGFAMPSLAAYSLVWSDEFDGTELDTANWTIDVGNGCPDLCGWGNSELEWYRAENVNVSGGNLVLTAKEEYYGGSYFTSGKVLTRDKQSFRYGRIEMRAKLPVGDGLWPAFWMMPQDDVYGGWASSGEIDILESSNDMTYAGGALHFGGTWPDNTSTGDSYSLGGTSFADDFHVYAIEWEPTEIRWYVDGVNFMTRTNTQWWSDGAPDNDLAPFDQDFFIILNLAVGGWYSGCTEPSCITNDLPQSYLIDYVRVYQDTGNIAPTCAITAPANGAALPSGDITVTVEAADENGSIDRVEFYADGDLLGQDTTAPYTYTWAGTLDGCYLLTARAFDDEGAFAEDTVDITVGAGCGQGPYLVSPFVLPTKIETEDYDIGGPGVAYGDTDTVNEGEAYRTDEGVDIQVCSDTGGGYNTGWTYAGEWLEYTVYVPAAGDYTIETRVSAPNSGRTFHLEFGGVDRTGELAVPQTGGWQTWDSVTTTVTLEAGLQVMRFIAGTDGFNVNSFDIRSEATAAPMPAASGHVLHPASPNPFNPSTTIAFDLGAATDVTLTVYDVSGRLVRSLLAGETRIAGHHEIVWDGRADSGRAAATGVYFYRLDAREWSQTMRMTLVK